MMSVEVTIYQLYFHSGFLMNENVAETLKINFPREYLNCFISYRDPRKCHIYDLYESEVTEAWMFNRWNVLRYLVQYFDS